MACDGGEGTIRSTVVHPFDALKFPCISLELALDIAQQRTRCAHEAVCTPTMDYVAIYKEEQYQQLQLRNNAPPIRRNRVAVERREYTSNQSRHRRRKIRIGYISPDFTSRHPLAFLMQHVFRHHNKSEFEVYIYSLSSSVTTSSSTSNDDKDGQELKAICESADIFTTLSPLTMSPRNMYCKILDDKLDILIDLC